MIHRLRHLFSSYYTVSIHPSIIYYLIRIQFRLLSFLFVRTCYMYVCMYVFLCMYVGTYIDPSQATTAPAHAHTVVAHRVHDP